MKQDDTENLEEMARLFMNGNTREMELEGFEVVPDYYEEKRPPRIRKSEESFDDEDEYEDEFEEEQASDDELEADGYEDVETPSEDLDDEFDEDEYEEPQQNPVSAEAPEYLDDDEYEEDYDYEVTDEEIVEALEKDSGISEEDFVTENEIDKSVAAGPVEEDDEDDFEEDEYESGEEPEYEETEEPEYEEADDSEPEYEEADEPEPELEYEEAEDPGYESSEDIRAEIDEMDDEEAEGSGIFAKIMIAVGAVAIIVLGLVTVWFLYSRGIIFKKDKPAPDVVADETVVDDTTDTDNDTGTGTEPVSDTDTDENAKDPKPAPEDQIAEEDPSKDYGEADYENSVEIGLEAVSVLKDLKVKFINTQTGKLIANIPFEVEVSFPDGSSDTWSDSDKDGIIYHDGLAKGSYTIKAREIKDEKYSSYKMPASKVAEVRGEIAYTAVNVADEVLTSSQVDENAEDTARGGADTGGETQVITAPVVLTDTVAYVDSSSSETYEETDKSQVVYTGTVADIFGQQDLSTALDTFTLSGENRIPTPATSADTGTTPDYSVSLEKGYTEIGIGSVTEIAITLRNVDASGVTVTSSDEKIATVSQNADKLTITGVAAGTASVTVSVNEKPEISAKIDVRVLAEGETGSGSAGGENGGGSGGTGENSGSGNGSGTGENGNSGNGNSGNGTGTGENGNTQTDTSSQKMKFTDGAQVYVYENGGYREAVNADYNSFSQFFRKKVKYTGWQTIDGGKYFYTSEGNAVTGDQVISGVKYSFDSTGKLVSEGGGSQSTVTGDGTLGIDVSKWNGNIDWTKVKNAGISYAIIRVGYRGSSKGSLIDDSMFKTNIAGATAAGIKVGVYFFSQAVNEVEAVEEASMVIDRLSGYGLSLPVYLDVEKSGGRGDNIDKNMRTAVCKTFCQTITNAGYRAGVYSNKNWLTEKINTGELAGYSIWVAHYTDTCGYTGSYSMWQYTDKGSVDGISGDVDLNRSYF